MYCVRQRDRRAGFTMIELLAATVLAAMLMIGVLYLTRSIAYDRQVIAGQQHVTKSGRVHAIEQLLRWDLANARWIKIRDDQLTLTGFNLMDFATGQPTYRSGVVTYHLARGGDLSMLVRQQSDPHSRRLDNSQSNLVAVGVEEFEVVPIDPDEPQQDELSGLFGWDGDRRFADRGPFAEPADDEQAQAESDDFDADAAPGEPDEHDEDDAGFEPLRLVRELEPLPPAVQVTLRWQDEDRPDWNRVILLDSAPAFIDVGDEPDAAAPASQDQQQADDAPGPAEPNAPVFDSPADVPDAPGGGDR